MGLTVAILALLVAGAPSGATACIPDPPGTVAQADAEAFIRKAETDWAASVGKDEAAFLRRATAATFVAVYDGAVLNREMLIAGAEKRPRGSASDSLATLRVHLFGATAIAEGDEIWTEAASRRRIVWSDLWVHCGGEWRLVTSTAVGSPAGSG